MSIGEDIEEVLEEVGIAYTILRDAGNVSGEYTMVKTTSQATKPITLEHFRRGKLSYNTDAITGDVIEFDVPGERFMVMNKLPVMLENEIFRHDCIFYKCNVVSGELIRPSGESDDWPEDTYHKEQCWETICDDCDAMQVAALYGNDLETDQELALLSLRKDELYIPHSVGIRAMDRFQPSSGEFYMVSSVETRRFPGVDVAILEEDHR